ncbi:MAG: ABC transporter ATP-binding protein [Spirochaetes bacterium]|nr:ABC transporter ATP-binding protein [Spirochaetota bacterium]
MKQKNKFFILFRCLSFLKPYLKFTVSAIFTSVSARIIAIIIPLLIKTIIDRGIKSGNLELIIFNSSFLVGLSLIESFFNFLTGRWTEKASQNVAYDIRNKLHEKVHKLSFSFHDQTESGQILTRSIRDVDIIRFLTGRSFIRLLEILVLVIGIITVMMIKLNKLLALSVVLIIPIIAFNAFKFGRQFRPMSMKIREKEEDLTTVLEQNLRGSRIVKAFGMEEQEINKFNRYNNELLELEIKSERLRARFLPLMNFLINFSSLLILVFGGYFVILKKITIGELVAFTSYIALLQLPLRRFGMIMSFITQAAASGERIFEILDLDIDIKEKKDAIDLKNVKGELELKNVTFSYFTDFHVLENVSFKVNPGEIIAILGITGSGKTSIINLIPRFYEPKEGEILIDGINIKDLKIRSLRSNIGLVLQETLLFASTIRENILFGVENYNESDLIHASKIANVHDFISDFPEGYDTVVGEKGITLSGGQKQRIAIARAILKNPKILILDDATSSVDTETESMIQKSLNKLMKNRTCIVIAQRLSTVRLADKVLVMDNGKIVDYAEKTGNLSCHEILMGRSNLYKEIFYNQLFN